MSAHGDTLDVQEAELLQAALSTAFQPTHIPVVEPVAPSTSSTNSKSESPTPETPSDSSLASSVTSDDSWKSDYDSHLASWRAASAVQRENAEKERARWEALRAQDKGWETVEDIPGPPNPLFRSFKHAAGSSSSPNSSGERANVPQQSSSLGPSPADARGLTSGETPGGHGVEVLETTFPSATGPKPLESSFDPPAYSSAVEPGSSQLHTRTRTGSKTPASQGWEDFHVSSSDDMALSYPDLSFTSPSSPPRHGERGTRADEGDPASRPAPPPSATLTVFNPSISWRTRALAVLSSIGINMFLPFINGMMLGFGEIAAKNIVVWIGWRVPGGAASAVGIGSVPRSKRAQEDKANVQRR